MDFPKKSPLVKLKINFMMKIFDDIKEKSIKNILLGFLNDNPIKYYILACKGHSRTFFNEI